MFRDVCGPSVDNRRGRPVTARATAFGARNVERSTRLLVADWKRSDTGREAKFYKLTKKGRAHLEAEAASWERLTGAIAAILSTAKGEAS